MKSLLALSVVLLVGFCLSQDGPSAIHPGHVHQSLEFSPNEEAKGLSLNVLKNKLPRSFTFECWFFHEHGHGLAVHPIVSRMKKTDAPHNGLFDFLLFIKNDNELIFFMGDGRDFLIFEDRLFFTPNQWHHVGLVVNHHIEGNTTNSLEVTIYLDAKPVWPFAAVNGALRQWGDEAPVLIGSAMNQDPNEHFFAGFMDEIRFWSVPLKEEEILKFSKQPLSGSEPSLLLYYNMDFEQAYQKNLLVDKSPNGLNCPLPKGIKKVFKTPPFPFTLIAPCRDGSCGQDETANPEHQRLLTSR
eukprot:TRINITY_DN1588_c0_g1_i2.p1 TRINITY_DN1588_c0_g1~~TRINITY_DN1588_c0_g1_i2.p1  ORF type:complete len:299 (-),score=56.35 TRINITY_DN1588_c0_g1_i2:136-1032(-)